MMRAVLMVSLLVLAACVQPASQAAAAHTPACDEVELSGLTAAECRLEAAGQTMQVVYAAAAGVDSGVVTVNVLGERGQVAQALAETNVAEYLPLSVEDIDGDGRADILIPRVLGNVNFEWGVWVYNGQRQHYERVGEVSGVEIERTADGYIAVPARSSAASWNVAFYRLDEGGLHPLLTLRVDGEELAGGRIRSQCSLSEAPGLAELNLDERAAREKFCAEPAAGVFEP